MGLIIVNKGQESQYAYARPTEFHRHILTKRDACVIGTAKRNSGTGNRTLGSAVLISQVMRARNVSHYTIPDDDLLESEVATLFQGRRDTEQDTKWVPSRE